MVPAGPIAVMKRLYSDNLMTALSYDKQSLYQIGTFSKCMTAMLQTRTSNGINIGHAAISTLCPMLQPGIMKVRLQISRKTSSPI